MSISIRPETAGDASAIHALTHAAFLNAAHTAHTEQFIVDALRDVGTLLMRGALRQLQEEGAAGCLLVGDPAYYSRFGFRPEPALVLAGVPPEYFQARAFTAAIPRGTVTFHAAFSTTR